MDYDEVKKKVFQAYDRFESELNDLMRINIPHSKALKILHDLRIKVNADIDLEIIICMDNKHKRTPSSELPKNDPVL